MENQLENDLRSYLARRTDIGAELSDIFRAPSKNAAAVGTKQQVPLPSRVTRASDALKSCELHLRIKQAEDLVTTMRGLVADKSFHFVHVLRNADKTKKRAMTRKAISEIEFQLQSFAAVYHECRLALVILNAAPAVLETFKVLEDSHLKASTAVLDPNAVGSTRPTTSWLWCVGEISPTAPGSVLECMFSMPFVTY